MPVIQSATYAATTPGIPRVLGPWTVDATVQDLTISLAAARTGTNGWTAAKTIRLRGEIKDNDGNWKLSTDTGPMPGNIPAAEQTFTFGVAGFLAAYQQQTTEARLLVDITGGNVATAVTWTVRVG